MPKPFGATKKAKVIQWLKDNPGYYRAIRIMRDLYTYEKIQISHSFLVSILSEQALNRPDWIYKQLDGKNVRWVIKSYKTGEQL